MVRGQFVGAPKRYIWDDMSIKINLTVTDYSHIIK